MDKKCKIFNFEVKQIGEESDRVLRFVGSDETPDRDNDIIEVAGWKIDDYLKNPVFMWAHKYDEPPIGKAINVTTDLTSKKLLFDIKFATAEEYPFADTIYRLYKGGYLNGTSVGFRGTKFKTRDDESVLGLPDWQRGTRYVEQNLLELSAVPVPCNPNALQSVKSKGFKDEDIKEIFIEDENNIKTDESADRVEFNNESKILTITNEGQEKKFTLEFLKSLDEDNDEDNIKSLIEKSGATLSAKNKKLLKDVHDGIDKCRQDLKAFLDDTEPNDEGDEEDKSILTTNIKVDISDDFKQALEEIKSQVFLLSQKLEKQNIKNDANKEIDLDAIEFVEVEKDVATDELTIEPNELKNMIEQVIKEELGKF